METLAGKRVDVVGGGLAGCEAALQLAARGISVRLVEMRPNTPTPVHAGSSLAELVCSNSLKSQKPDSAAGMLKGELAALGSFLLNAALSCAVPAGGALAVDRERFSCAIEESVASFSNIQVVRAEVVGVRDDGALLVRDEGSGPEESSAASALSPAPDALIVASGPLTSDALAASLQQATGAESLAFYDAAAPIVMADSLNGDVLFRQSRYEDEGAGDYLNAPFTKDEYERFIAELVAARRVIAKDFETRELFQACQPIEEIARKGADAPRFGALKPVGLTDPRTGRRPWAALQLRAEDAHGMAYNLVGFQTNLTFGEQQRVFRLIPGLEHAEFARYGVMHRNTFVDAPRLLDATLRLKRPIARIPVRIAGQLAGTEGYCEAMRSGLHAALCTCAELADAPAPIPPAETAFGALLAWATDPATVDYQPMHVNFGIIPPLEARVRNKKDRYAAYAARGTKALEAHVAHLQSLGLLAESTGEESAHSHADNAAGQDAPATVSPAVCAKVDGLGRNVAFIASEGDAHRG